MSHFIPNGYLTIDQAIDRVVELTQDDNAVTPLTEEEAAILRACRDRMAWASRPKKPEPIVPISTVGYGGRRPSARTYTDLTPDRPDDVEPPRPDASREEIRDLVKKEADLAKQQHKASHAAGEVLQGLLYAGQAPSKTITNRGSLIETPPDIWGGEEWYKALRFNKIKFSYGHLGGMVSGRPLIHQDALEAAFSPDGPVEEEPKSKPAFPSVEDQQPVKVSHDETESSQSKYEEWTDQQSALVEGGMNLRDAAEQIAGKANVDTRTVERETRRIRRQRERSGIESGEN